MRAVRVFVLASLSFAALSLVVTSRADAAPIKVACVGDSITQLSGWPAMLGTELGAGYTSTNYGLSGTTLLKNGDHPYWTSQQFTDSHNANPDIVVIMLGTNDSKPFNWDTHKGEFVGDYEALVDSYAALPSHPKIYLNLCPPAGVNGYQIVGSVIENEIIPDIKQVAAAKGVPTIDVFDAFGGHNLDTSLFSAGDQVHPNAKGAQLIADTVYAALTGKGADGGANDGGAKTDASSDAGGASDATSTTGAAGNGPSMGTAGAGGAAGATATGTGGTSGAGTAGAVAPTGAAGATATGVAGTTGPGTAGGTGSTGAAGSGAKPPHANSGGCAVAATGSRSVSVLGLGLGLFALSRARRRRR
jgi:lysophospholipase L1-like esterase